MAPPGLGVMLKSISVCWSSQVQDEEAVQCLAAVVGIVTYLYHTRWPWGIISPIVDVRPFGNWVIPAMEQGSPYSSFEWYVDTAYREDWQAMDAEHFLRLVEEEPWQQGSHHFDFSIAHLPLRRESSSSHLPLAVLPGIAGVVSVDWVRFYGNVEAQRLALRRVALYAMGRTFGLEPHSGDEPLCAMRSFVGHSDLMTKAVEEHKAQAIYCDDCVGRLLGILLSGRGPLN